MHMYTCHPPTTHTHTHTLTLSAFVVMAGVTFQIAHTPRSPGANISISWPNKILIVVSCIDLINAKVPARRLQTNDSTLPFHPLPDLTYPTQPYPALPCPILLCPPQPLGRSFAPLLSIACSLRASVFQLQRCLCQTRIGCA